MTRVRHVLGLPCGKDSVARAISYIGIRADENRKGYISSKANGFFQRQDERVGLLRRWVQGNTLSDITERADEIEAQAIKILDNKSGEKEPGRKSSPKRENTTTAA